MIDFDFSNNNKPQAGSLLISDPFMHDDYFTRSVVLLCDHNDEGSFGFVLNKYIETPTVDVIPDITESSIKISIGGPVDNSNLFFVHSLGEELKNAIKMAEGLYIGGDYEQLKGILNNHPEKLKSVRFFIGYSGWSPNQLQEEIDEKSWVVLNNVRTKYYLNTEDETLWNSLMEKLGGKFKVMSKFPINPSDN